MTEEIKKNKGEYNMKYIIFFIVLFMFNCTVFANINKRHVLIDKITGKVVGQGYSNFENHDKTKYEVIEVDDLPDLNVENLKFKDGKIIEKTETEKKEQEDLKKEKEEKDKKNKKDAIKKLKDLGLTDEEINALLYR